MGRQGRAGDVFAAVHHQRVGCSTNIRHAVRAPREGPAVRRIGLGRDLGPLQTNVVAGIVVVGGGHLGGDGGYIMTSTFALNNI